MSEAGIRGIVFVASWIVAGLIIGSATSWATGLVLVVSFVVALVLSFIDLIVIGAFHILDDL